VFRLYDFRRDQVADIPLVRGRNLRVRVAAPASRPARADDLRSALLADLIRRNAEMHGLTISYCRDEEPGQTGEDGRAGADSFPADCLALNIHPPDECPPGAASGGIQVGGPDQADGPGSPASGHWARSERALVEGRELAGTDDGGLVAGLTRRGLDPLALRLAFLEHRYRQPVDLSEPELADAGRALDVWRGHVAEWATQPSQPLSAGYAAEVGAAFDNDLDTPAALRVLRALAVDRAVPPGSMFETFAYVDRFLGLDLVREVGRAR
jgi:hypothetical protein